MIDDIHPVIKNQLPTLGFLNAAYKGKQAWFEDYPRTTNKNQGIEKVITTQKNNSIVDFALAECFLPLEELEREAVYRHKYYYRLRRSRWKPLLKETIKVFCGILSNYIVKEETYSYQADKKEEWLNNIDLIGNNHYSFFSKCDRLALLEGWCAVWVNSSMVENPPDNFIEQQKLDYRPYLQIIKRSQITDYQIANLSNGEHFLIKLVYKETVYEEGQEIEQFVEILIGEVNIYRRDDSDKKKYELFENKKYDLSYIPIVFYPINNADPFEQEFPLLEIAEDNKVHYQIYSDYRESLHYQSLPVFVRIGLIRNAGDAEGLSPVTISPYAVVDLPENGDLKIVETSGVAINLNKEELKEIEASILSKSLAFLDRSSPMTATEATLRSVQFKASFDVFADQKSSAITEIFKIWADWRGTQLEGQGITINDSIFKLTSPELIREFKDLLSQGFLDLETFWKLLDYWGTLPKGINIEEVLEKVIGKIREDQTPRDTT